MKIKTTKIALWSMLVAMSIPLTSQAVDYDLSVARKFYINGEANPGSTGKSAAASTNKMYVAPTDKTDLYYEKMASTCSQGTIASGYSSGQLGSAIANDEAGNIVFHAGEYWAKNPPTKFTIIPAGATGMSGKKEITITSPGGRCDFIRATGNLLSGTGYIWFAPQNTKKVVAAKVTNGAYVSNTTYTVNGMTNNFNAISSAYMYGSNKMFIHNQADAVMYDCTVSGTTVTATAITSSQAIVNVSGNFWQSLVGNIMFELRGHKILVRSNATVNQGTQFSVIDMTAGVALYDNYATWGSSTTTGIDGTGVWPTILNEDDNNVAIYVYCPTHGFGKYVVKATQKAITIPTAPVENLTATVDANNNATVSWAVPNYDTSTATVTGYTITIGSASPITVAASVSSYNLGVISSSTTFTIVPNYALISDPSTTGSGTAQSVTVKPAGNVGPPRSFTATPYQGRSLVELNWLIPADTYEQPNGYSVYRDGVLILANQNSLQFVDSNVSAGQHEYTVVSIYNGIEYPGCSATTVVSVEPFNTANNVYQIEEVYNYMVGSGDGYDISNTFDGKQFSKRDMWRQGAVFDGKWYIAMGGLSSSPGAGIYMFDLNDPRQTPTKLNLSPEILVGQNNGIAFDEAGNIVIRKQWETTPTSAYDIGVGLWNVMVYKRKADGTYETGKKVDLSGLGFIDTAQRVTGFGRVDYYTLKGNIFSSAGAKFPLAITQKKYGTAGSTSYTNTQVSDFCLVNLYLDGSTVKARGTSVTLGEPFRIKDYDEDDNKKFNGKFIEECYAFYNAANPNQIILQARSDGYALFNEADLTSNGANGTYIYNHEGATNNSGGTTILWGNDLLFMNPYDLNSANMGTFRIAIAEHQDLTRQIPLINVVQSERSSNIMGYSNGSWIHAEQAVDTDGEECIYIYNYVPATRFSKYKLTRSGTYSFPEPDIEIEPEYGTSDNNPESDLIRYNATLNWERPKTSTGDYWPLDGDNPLVKYRVSVVDKNGTPYSDAAGTVYDNFEVTAANNPSFAESTVELPLMKDFADDEPYTIKVKAVYDFGGKEKESFERTATSRYTYDPQQPGVSVVNNVARNVPYNQAWNASGENIFVRESFDIYRINITFANPQAATSGGYTIPVSYYTLEVDKKDGLGYRPVADYPQYVATDGYSVGTDGKTEVSTYGESIPGDTDLDGLSYEFYYFVSHGRTYEPLRTLAVGDASDEDPSIWEYRLTANYGSSETAIDTSGNPTTVSTKGIAKSAYGEAVPTETITSVEGIQDAGQLRAFPVPADGQINVKSPVAINTIEFYSVSGALVKRVAGNGAVDATIDIADLAAGTYIVSINGSMSLTIVKK